MPLTPKHLNLTESYEFDILSGEGNNWFAGTLKLDPKKIELTVSGEESGDRSYPFELPKKSAVFGNHNQTFILFELKPERGKWRTIGGRPKNIVFFEQIYSAEYVIYLPYELHSTLSTDGIRIHSSTVSRWVGFTEKQKEILRDHSHSEPLSYSTTNLSEFEVQANSGTLIGVFYNISKYWSAQEFKSQFTFPPCFAIDFTSPIENHEILVEFRKIYSLLEFLTGQSLEIEKVELKPHHTRRNSASLYYPSISKTKNKNNSILFPLGKDTLFNQTGLPPLQLDIFRNYYLLTEKNQGYFTKYLRYKYMTNTEDRFLGYFRVIESLTRKQKEYLDPEKLNDLLIRSKPFLHKKFKDKKNVNSFIKGITRYNKSKYNTAKCIQDFYNEIPSATTKYWKYQKHDIQKICQLRNDITHANDYQITNQELYLITCFIELLLIFALALQLGIKPENCAEFVQLTEYHRVLSQNNTI